MSAMTELTEQRLSEIQARCDQATPGPWVGRTSNGMPVIYQNGYPVCMVFVYGDNSDNAAFIANARQDIPDLLAERAAFKEQHAADQAEIKRLREAQAWISTDERLPTQEDADSAGCVTVWHDRYMWATQAPYSIVRDGLYKHWMPALRPPEATP